MSTCDFEMSSSDDDTDCRWRGPFRGKVRYVLSLGCRCYVSQVLKGLVFRCGAGPFDQCYSSARMVRHCLHDNFDTFLDPKLLVTRTLSNGQQVADHKVYCRLVGRERVLFPHRGPDREAATYRRWVTRFLTILRRPERKLLVLAYDASRRLPSAGDGNSDKDIMLLYEQLLQRGVTRFELVAIRVKVTDKAMKTIRTLQRRPHFRHVEIACLDGNTGRHFRTRRDFELFCKALKGRRRFAVLPDPLPPRRWDAVGAASTRKKAKPRRKAAAGSQPASCQPSPIASSCALSPHVARRRWRRGCLRHRPGGPTHVAQPMKRRLPVYRVGVAPHCSESKRRVGKAVRPTTDGGRGRRDAGQQGRCEDIRCGE